MKPFLKWAGGKTQILAEIQKKYPIELGGEIDSYCEPFVGGGAIFLDIVSKYNLKRVLINDINGELIGAYRQVQGNVERLIEQLQLMQDSFWAKNPDERREYYNDKRSRFNRLISESGNDLERAALFIFLNKTCFNGLYRVNAKGLFNVPIGSYKAPPICDRDNLMDISRALEGVEIRSGDYKNCIDFIGANTFVYIDPPYRPLTESASFTAYSEKVFGDKEQLELGRFIDEIHKKGAKVVASNSDPKNVDEDDNFFDIMYKSYDIERIYANRMINSKGSSRGKISELLISNFLRRNEMSRDFKKWLSTFKSSIADYKYYTDFEKIHRNVNAIKVELNILNSLIGSSNIVSEFEDIVTKYPETLKCIPILLAVRAKEIYAIDSDGEFTYSFEHKNHSIEQYKAFMVKTGLFNLLQRHIINNLVDYVSGVETGLDSNGRKNRGGHLMEDLVEGFLKTSAVQEYFKEMKLSDVQAKWNIDLSAISNQGKTEKRFDFVVKGKESIYAIETNFYGSNGSKLNETARSYKNLAIEARSIKGFAFVWFTDGTGWNGARNNLEETFDIMEHIYNIEDMKNGIMNKIFI